jgi:hypothetical protein
MQCNHFRMRLPCSGVIAFTYDVPVRIHNNSANHGIRRRAPFRLESQGQAAFHELSVFSGNSGFVH